MDVTKPENDGWRKKHVYGKVEYEVNGVQYEKDIFTNNEMEDSSTEYATCSSSRQLSATTSAIEEGRQSSSTSTGTITSKSNGKNTEVEPNASSDVSARERVAGKIRRLSEILRELNEDSIIDLSKSKT